MMASNNGSNKPSPGSSPSPLGPIPSAISKALQSNLALQSELKRRLLKIKRAQVQNRRNAERVSASISQCWGADPEYSLGGSHASNSSTSLTAKIASQEVAASTDTDATKGVERSQCTTTKDKEDTANEGDDDILEEDRIAPKLSDKRWACNPTRIAKRGYFVDPEGSSPGMSSVGDTLCQSNEVNADGPGHTRIIFEIGASERSEKEPQKSWAESKRKNSPHEPVYLRLKKTSYKSPGNGPVASFSFADTKKTKAKFTKQECLHIMSLVRKLGDEDKDVDWHEIALKHHAKFNKQTQTPWTCFSQYRSSLQTPATRCPPWSPEEDELLLKYLAVHGPQYLHQGDTLTQICKNIFPLRNTKQLTLRAQSTLINPNYIHADWDTDEKRKLALLMRVYSNEVNPINSCSRTVHYPNRAKKGVAEKWIKTLDPALSHRPLTAQEAEGLSSSGQWSPGVAKMFPNRSCNNLKKRWTELADEKSVATHCANTLISKKLGKRGKRLAGGSDEEELGPDDFMILPRSKKSKLKRKS